MAKKSKTEEVEETNVAKGEETSSENTSTPTKSKGSKSVIFTIRNANVKDGVSTRTFRQESHGDDFESLAESFEKANTHKTVVKPTSKDDVAGIAKFNEDTVYNRDIKHPIISKEVK